MKDGGVVGIGGWMDQGVDGEGEGETWRRGDEKGVCWDTCPRDGLLLCRGLLWVPWDMVRGWRPRIGLPAIPASKPLAGDGWRAVTGLP